MSLRPNSYYQGHNPCSSNPCQTRSRSRSRPRSKARSRSRTTSHGGHRPGWKRNSQTGHWIKINGPTHRAMTHPDEPSCQSVAANGDYNQRCRFKTYMNDPDTGRCIIKGGPRHQQLLLKEKEKHDNPPSRLTSNNLSQLEDNIAERNDSDSSFYTTLTDTNADNTAFADAQLAYFSNMTHNCQNRQFSRCRSCGRAKAYA